MVSEREYSDSGDEGYEETVRGDDEEDAQLANEFQGLRVSSWLNGGTGTESSEPSTLSFRTTSDAASITSDFLEHPAAYATSASKLLVQQALLVEFGVCQPPSTQGRDAPLRNANNPGPQVPLPTSLTRCAKLLRENVHVNIADYLKLKKAGRSIAGLERFPNRKALQKSLNTTGRFVKRAVAKAELLQPLLTTCNHGRRA